MKRTIVISASLLALTVVAFMAAGAGAPQDRLEPATEWRDRRAPSSRPVGVAGRLRALLKGREER